MRALLKLAREGGIASFIGFNNVSRVVVLEMVLGHMACYCLNMGQYRAILHLEPFAIKHMISINLTIGNSYIWNSKVLEICLCLPLGSWFSKFVRLEQWRGTA